MFHFGEIWQRFTGSDQPLPHCAAHQQYESDCVACAALQRARRNSWQPDFAAGDDSMNLGDVSSGSDLNPGSYLGDVGSTTADSVDSSSGAGSSGFDGFDGGDSGGGGASGDW